MHKTLLRQISKYLKYKEGDPEYLELSLFLKAVDDTYKHFDEDRDLLARSLEVSSAEFAEVNKKLKNDNIYTEKKIEERTKELVEERSKLREISDHMKTGAVLIDKDNNILFSNDAVKKLLYLTELVDVSQLFNKFNKLNIKGYIANTFLNQESEIKEAELNASVLKLSFVPISNNDGIFACLIWIDDITEQISLEQSKSQFLSIASHEMRTPLSIIRGSSEIMLEEDIIKNNSELKESITNILNASIRLLGIVNDFLDLQSIDNGKIILDSKKTNIIKIFQKVMSDMTNIIKEKNLYIRVKYPGDINDEKYMYDIDPNRLEQIAINLISNAVHYTTQGGIDIDIEDNLNGLKVLITDTGTGIGEEDQKRLFKKFETGAKFLHSKEYGSGLGLYIASTLAKIMGHNILLDKSELGVGSTFAIYLNKK